MNRCSFWEIGEWRIPLRRHRAPELLVLLDRVAAASAIRFRASFWLSTAARWIVRFRAPTFSLSWLSHAEATIAFDANVYFERGLYVL